MNILDTLKKTASSRFVFSKRQKIALGIAGLSSVGALLLYTKIPTDSTRFLLTALLCILALCFGSIIGSNKRTAFYKEEAERLKVMMKDLNPAKYIKLEQEALKKASGTEARTLATLNLASGYLNNAQPTKALETVQTLNPRHLTQLHCILYYNTAVMSYISLEDEPNATKYYNLALDLMAKSKNDSLPFYFLLSRIGYLIYTGSYQEAMQLLENTEKLQIDQVSAQAIKAFKASIFAQTDKQEDAQRMAKSLLKNKLMPFTKAIVQGVLDI
ncbi:MAG: hypothetical protein PHG02_03615 [Oscillospiraceae bacterium]|nr:hypothetical protein [Oscillospiraceae bacterium]